MGTKVNSITEQGVIIYSAVLNKFKTNTLIVLNFEEMHALLFNKDFQTKFKENQSFNDYIQNSYETSLLKLKKERAGTFEKDFNDFKLIPHVIREPKIEKLLQNLKNRFISK